MSNLLETHPSPTVSRFKYPTNSNILTSPVSPQIFNAVGAGSNAFLFSGFFGLVKVVACLFFLLFLVERIGRRGSLILGAFMMGVYMLIVAVITATHPPVAGGGMTSASVASLTMIYLEASEFLLDYPKTNWILTRLIVTYNISWGPVPWVSKL